MVAAIGLAVCERTMVGTGWATSHPVCMDKLRKTLPYSGLFLWVKIFVKSWELEAPRIKFRGFKFRCAMRSIAGDVMTLKMES